MQALRGHTGRVADLDWSQDNTFLLTCGRDGDLCLWHVDSGSLVRKWEQGARLWPCPLACCRWGRDQGQGPKAVLAAYACGAPNTRPAWHSWSLRCSET